MTILRRVYSSKKCFLGFVKCNVLIFYEALNVHSPKRELCHASNFPQWKILFYGSDNFSLESLCKMNTMYQRRKLITRLEVVTLNATEKNVVSKYAKKNNLTLHTWPYTPVNNNFDIGVVISFGRLIPEEIINSFPLGMINVHASLLPRWRGAAPIIHALKNGDTKTGVSIMRIMPKKFDIGDILSQHEVNIHSDEKFPELYDKLAKSGSDLLIKTLLNMPDILYKGRPQSKELVTLAPKISIKTSYVNWEQMNAKNVYDLYRALYAMYNLRTIFNDKVIQLLEINIVSNPWDLDIKEKKVPGLVFYDKKKEMLFVCCSEYDWISVNKVILPGKTAITAKNFYNGYLQNRNTVHCHFKSYPISCM